MHFVDIENNATSVIKESPEIISDLTIGTTVCATVPAHIGNMACHALIDTGTTKSCMSESCYEAVMLPNLKNLHNISVTFASGENMNPMNIVTCTFHLGK